MKPHIPISKTLVAGSWHHPPVAATTFPVCVPSGEFVLSQLLQLHVQLSLVLTRS